MTRTPTSGSRRRGVAVAVAVALALAGAAGGSALAGASTRPGWMAPVSVATPPRPVLHGALHIGFTPRALPHGGFYYAVLVLSRYPSGGGAPPCAVSSDMGKTRYGFPSRGRRLALSILPARSGAETWCPGGHYLGALYAVPHRPRCSYSQPCYGRTTQLVGPCWITGEGKRVCGTVVRRPYSYPGGLPRPLDTSSRIVARFSVSFPPS
jgi:hypothetical protein